MNGATEFKIAYRNLIKRPIRTVFTLIAIILGVSIFFSVNVATDSLEYTLQDIPTAGDADKWINLFKGILMILSGVSLIICVIIIKNLMEMTKEEQIYELGLLRAVGSSKFGIFKIFFYQVLFIGTIGMVLGLLGGYFLSSLLFGPLQSILSIFTSLETGFEVEMHVSEITLILGITIGMVIPVIFGTIPAVSAAKSDVLAALNPRMRLRKTKLQSAKTVILQFIFSILMIVVGILIVQYGFEGLLDFSTNPTNQTSIAIASLFLAALIFISGSILLGSILLPYISYIFSVLFKPLLLKMRKICYRNLSRNSRRTRNTFLMISLSLSFLITVSITVSSIEAGIIPGAHMRLGGDIILTSSNTYHQRNIPLSTAKNISKIEHVENVCEVKNSYYYVENRTVCDSFGTKTGEYLMLIVINTTSYVEMHSKSSIYKYNGDNSFHDFIHKLDKNGTVIIQKELSDSIQKTESEIVNITTSSQTSWLFPAMTSNLTIVGIMEILPGIPHSWNEDWSTLGKKYCAAVISWNTFFNITGLDYSSSTCNFWINCDDPNNANIVRNDIADLYQNLGSPWNNSNINFNDSRIVRTILDDISDIREVLNLVLIVVVSILYMALTISMIGLVTTMVMNVNQRKSEIGMLRSLGISKWQVIQMVFGETLIICATSLIIGIICGFLTGILVSNVPLMVYAPVIFTVQWDEIIILSIFVSILSLITSIIPAIKAIKLNIINSIRKRGM